MAIVENEGQPLQNREYRKHLDRNWDNINSFEKNVNSQIKQVLRDPPPSTADEIAQLRIDVNGNEYPLAKPRVDTIERNVGKMGDLLADKANKDEVRNLVQSLTVSPEYIESVSVLKSKYPNGADGLFFITDIEHKYYWDDGKWIDGGPYTMAEVAKYSLNPLAFSTGVLKLDYDKINHLVVLDVPHLEFSYQQNTFVSEPSKITHSVKGDSGDYVVLYLIFNTSDSSIDVIDNRDIAQLPSTAFIVQKYNILDKVASQNIPVLFNGKAPSNIISKPSQKISSIGLVGDFKVANKIASLSFAATGTIITSDGNYTIKADNKVTLDVSDGSDYIYVYMNPTTVGNAEIYLLNNKKLGTNEDDDILLGSISIGAKKADLVFPLHFDGQLEFDGTVLNGRTFNVNASEPFVVNFEQKIVKLPKYLAIKTPGWYIEGGNAAVPFADGTGTVGSDNFNLQTLWFDASGYKYVCRPTNSSADKLPRYIKLGDFDLVHETASFISDVEVVNKGTNAVFPISSIPKPFFKNHFDDISERVKEHETLDTFTISLITDSHYCKGYTYKGTSYIDTFARNYAHLVNQNETDKFVDPIYKVHLGDVAQGFTSIGDQMRDLSMSAGVFFDTNKPAFMIAGNHDWNIGAFNEGIKDAQLNRWQVYSRINKPSQKFGISQTQDKDHGAYTYRDDEHKLVSFFLNSYDNIDGQKTDGSPIVNSFAQIGFSGQQVRFIVDELLKVPDDYNVIAYTHASLEGVMEIGSGWTYNGDLVRELFEAFNDSKAIKGASANPIPAGLEDYYGVTIDADFTGKPTKRVITIINGHWHIDNSQTVNGILYIENLCSLADDASSKVARPFNTYQEDAYDYMTVDREHRKLYFTRFGAGEDRAFDY